MFPRIFTELWYEYAVQGTKQSQYLKQENILKVDIVSMGIFLYLSRPETSLNAILLTGYCCIKIRPFISFSQSILLSASGVTIKYFTG